MHFVGESRMSVPRLTTAASSGGGVLVVGMGEGGMDARGPPSIVSKRWPGTRRIQSFGETEGVRGGEGGHWAWGSSSRSEEGLMGPQIASLWEGQALHLASPSTTQSAGWAHAFSCEEEMSLSHGRSSTSLAPNMDPSPKRLWWPLPAAQKHAQKNSCAHDQRMCQGTSFRRAA